MFLLYCSLHGELFFKMMNGCTKAGKEEKLSLETVLREYPAKPIHLYKPEAGDWYGETKKYLCRVRDGQRRTEALRERAELLDSIDDPDKEFNRYRDETHQKLEKAERGMIIVTEEVRELIGQLPSTNQRTVMTKRYVDQLSL